MSQDSYYSQSRRSSASSGGKRTAHEPSRQGGGDGQPPRKRRRRRRMGPLGALLYVVLVVGVSALLAGVAWTWANDVLALNKDPLTATVEIREGDDLSDVADLLKDSGLIEYKGVFKLFSTMTHVDRDEKITPGTYELNTDMDYMALITNMGKRSATRKVVTVTIPEGMKLDQVFKLLSDQGVCTLVELTTTAASYDFNYSFLKGVLPLGDSHRLEGYLFPDTYNFYTGEDPVRVLNKMILRFDQVFTDELRGKAGDMGRSMHDIIIIASMIEKETTGEDQTAISQVIYNRLLRPTSETAGYLGIDATIAYVTGQKVTDTSYPTPYNTYTNQGLPPGPIANPGLASIYAALNPDSDYKKYYYYALGDDGAHHFFKTLKEQQSFTATQELYKR